MSRATSSSSSGVRRPSCGTRPSERGERGHEQRLGAHRTSFPWYSTSSTRSRAFVQQMRPVSRRGAPNARPRVARTSRRGGDAARGCGSARSPIASTSRKIPASAQTSARLNATDAAVAREDERVRHLHVVPGRREAVAEEAARRGRRRRARRAADGIRVTITIAASRASESSEPAERALVVGPRLRRLGRLHAGGRLRRAAARRRA